MICSNVLLRFPINLVISFQHFIWTVFISLMIFGTRVEDQAKNKLWRDTLLSASFNPKCGVSIKVLCCLFKTPQDYLKDDFANKEIFETYNP